MSVARVRAVCAVAVAALLFAACGSDAGSGGPTWKPKPSFNGEGNPPDNQQPGNQPDPGSPSSSGSSSTAPKSTADPNVVATNLTAPTGVAILPDNTALVGERTTGRIVRVRPQPKRPVQVVRTIPHLSTAGGGGLLDLAISPNYGEDNLIFAYITTAIDNRVVAFTLKGAITTVLKGIPRGTTDNTGRLSFLPDGTLLVGTGDAGHPTAAVNPKSLAGKVLRVTDIGTAAPSNPTPGSRVYASGFRQSDGLCPDPDSKAEFQTEALGATEVADPINALVAGATYGWPTAQASDAQPLVKLPETSRSPGGCAVLDHVLYATSLDGKVLLSATIKTAASGKTTLGAFAPMLRNKYGRLRTVVAAADGALWLTTSNRDGNGKPVKADERVLRIVPSGGGGPQSST
jgi:glucose/arabinose dehydrogenase